MNLHQLIRDLRENNGSKIVLVVADGLGGLPIELGGKTELETARTPNLDAMVREGICGLSIPVLPGITPGSGPGHLGLFGYDPLESNRPSPSTPTDATPQPPHGPATPTTMSRWSSRNKLQFAKHVLNLKL